MTSIYLDHHATTPVDPRVLERMLPFFGDAFGNASSRNHVFGWKAEEAVEAARSQVAALIGASAREIIFTSGATEANNLAILGLAAAFEGTPKRHLITQATEHKAVLDPMRYLAKRGWRVTELPVDTSGRVEPAAVEAAIEPDTLLVSVMTVNNEVGTVQPVSEIGALCKRRGVFFHTDAAQGLGKVPLHVQEAGVDLLSISAHKMYGPKGVGALYVRRRDPRVTLEPMVLGGGHERGLRSGTLNVPGIVGLGEAARICASEAAEENARVRALRDQLWGGIQENVRGVHLNGPELGPERHPGNLNVFFEGVEAEPLIMAMRGVAVSSGAACASATLEPSHVLRALQIPAERAHGSLRFGLGRFNTGQEVGRVVELIAQKVEQVRALG